LVYIPSSQKFNVERKYKVSRVGSDPIIIPSGVNINYTEENIEVSGAKGKMSLKLRPEVRLEKNDNIILIKEGKISNPKADAMKGLFRVLINNMVNGVTKGFTKKLEIIGTGYKASVEGKKVILNLGYSYPYTYNIPDGIKVTVEEGTVINIEGIDKQQVGQVAADIRKMRPPEPYKGKGIKYSGEHVRRKAGKASK